MAALASPPPDVSHYAALVYIAAATHSQPVTVTGSPTVGGLDAADLIAVVAILVTIFGLMLSAIGVLLMTVIGNLRSDLVTFRAEVSGDMQSVWNAVDSIRTSQVGGRRSTDLPALHPKQ